MELSTLRNRIIDLLMSLPNIHDSDAQRVFVYQAELDPQLQKQISIGKSPLQFVELLVSTLIDYGSLADHRHALEAVLEAAKASVGQEKRANCDILIQEVRDNPAIFLQAAKSTQRATNIDPQIVPNIYINIEQILWSKPLVRSASWVYLGTFDKSGKVIAIFVDAEDGILVAGRRYKVIKDVTYNLRESPPDAAQNYRNFLQQENNIVGNIGKGEQFIIIELKKYEVSGKIKAWGKIQKL